MLGISIQRHLIELPSLHGAPCEQITELLRPCLETLIGDQPPADTDGS